MTIRRLPFAAVLLALLAGAWLRLEAAPASSIHRWRHPGLPRQTAPLPKDFDRSVERAATAITAVRFDIDNDGDIDVVGLDGALALLVWENDGAGRLTLKQPLTYSFVSGDAPDSSLDSPNVADDSSDQSDAPSVGLTRRCEPHILPSSRPLAADRFASLRSPSRSTRSPRAPPRSLRTV